MDRLRRDVILIRLIEALRERGSWCGATHVQKAMFFLQEMAGAETGFEFIPYKHGPFGFDLQDELTAMRADELVALQVQNPEYGPSLVPAAAADSLKQRFPKTLRKHEPLIMFVAEKLGNRKVVELERLATALYVSQEVGVGMEAHARAQRVHAMKPHISVDQALEAVRTVDDWRREATELKSG